MNHTFVTMPCAFGTIGGGHAQEGTKGFSVKVVDAPIEPC